MHFGAQQRRHQTKQDKGIKTCKMGVVEDSEKERERERGASQGRKPLVKVSCTRPHFTRQPREKQQLGEEEQERGEIKGGKKKQNKGSTKDDDDIAKSRLHDVACASCACRAWAAWAAASAAC